MSDFSKDLTKWINEKYPENDNPTWITTKEAAKRFGISPRTILNHKDNHSELVAGSDYISSSVFIDGQNRKVIIWSLSGITKLADIITTDEAKEHRKLTRIDPNRILQKIEILLKEELEPIPQLVQDVEILKNEMVHPITFSKLLRKFSDKRFEVKTKLDTNWQKIHDTAKNWTQKTKYEHMSPEEIREGMRRLDELLDSYNKK